MWLTNCADRVQAPLVKRGVLIGLGAAIAAGAAFERSAQGHERPPDGRRLDVDAYGVRVYEQGAGPAVVIVTGAGDCFASWRAVVDCLSDTAHVIGYDRPGIAYSVAGPPPNTERYLRELDRVVDAIAAGPVVLVGHSLGGLIVRLYATQKRDKVRGMVLVDATPEAIADDPGVKAGFAVSSAIAVALKALSPVGLPRALLRTHAMPLYPERKAFRNDVTVDAYQAWQDAVCRSIEGATAAELRSVLPTVIDARRSSDAESRP